MKCQPAGRATSRLWRGRFRGGDEPRRTQLANVAQRGAVSGEGCLSTAKGLIRGRDGFGEVERSRRLEAGSDV